jgi:YegS/Rv2252/BmrU family lipid kinase
VIKPDPHIPRRILAIFNPAAGRGRRSKFDRTIAELRELGCAVKITETRAPGHAEAIAQDASAREIDIVAAAGGDGTINEVANGLKGRNLALGVIPLGTANVVADELGLNRSPSKVAHALAYGSIKPIHVGVVNGRRFIMMAGIGFDAHVVRKISLPLKKNLGPVAYIWQATCQAFSESFTQRDMVIDGVQHRAVSIVACNGRRYGGPFLAAPDGSLEEATFHIVLMKGRGWFSIARYGLGLVLGRISMWSDVSVVKGKDMVIEGGEGGPVQADGDIVAALPAHIFIDPEPVHLIYPAP